MPTERKDLKTVDMKTGELVEGGLLVWMPQTRRSLFSKEGFVVMSQEAMERIANANLGGVASRVLWKLLARLDMENWINVNQANMAKELGLEKPNFHRAIKSLISEEIILEGPKVGRNCTYRLNPQYGWKGRTQSHVVALSDHMKNRMEAARISGVVSGASEREVLERAGQTRMDFE